MRKYGILCVNPNTRFSEIYLLLLPEQWQLTRPNSQNRNRYIKQETLSPLQKMLIMTKYSNEVLYASMKCLIFYLGYGMYLFGACWILFLFGILAAVFLSQHWPVVHTGMFILF